MPIKLSYKYVKQYIEKHDYKLLSNEYKNNKSKLKLKCPEGHEYKVKFNNFQQGQRCPFCAGNIKLTYTKIKQYVESKGYTLLSNTYKNVDTKLKLRCEKGHEYKVIFNHFKNGVRCPICYGNKKLSYNQVKQYVENEGYTLLSDTYKNNYTKLKIRCDKGHEYKVKFNDFQQGYRCPICFAMSTSSKAENEVANLVKELLPDNKVLCNDRTQITNPFTGHYLELDIFIPDLNKAIEYNGAYWHSLPKAIIRDKIKKEQCQEKNIDLLVIEENGWIENKYTQVKIIKNFLGI